MKTFIIYFFLILSASAFSQSEISGIGRFKIGMDISIIDSLKTEGYALKDYDKKDYNLRATSTNYFVEKTEWKQAKPKKKKPFLRIYEKPFSDSLLDYGESPMIKDKRVFLINYYNVSDIDIDFMELSFYNNKLYYIHISNNDFLNMALREKYKYVESEEFGKKTSCYNSYGTIDLQDSSKKYTFRNDEIYSYLTYSNFVYDCKLNTTNYVVIENKDITDDIFKREKKIFDDKYNDPNNEVKAPLKKL